VYSIGLITSVRERKFHANFDAENESSTYGTFVPENEFRSRVRKFQLPIHSSKKTDLLENCRKITDD